MFNIERVRSSSPEIENKKEFARLQRNQFKERIEGLLGKEDQEKVLKAFDFMVDLHLNQPDRVDGSPYFMHLVAAANNVIEFGVIDPDVLSAALLHDSIEDQNVKLTNKYLKEKRNVNLEEKKLPGDIVGEKLYRKIALKGIDSEFGEEVSQLVDAVTNPLMDDVVSLLDEKYKKDVKFAVYKNQMEWKASASNNKEKVLVVKLVDFLNNIMTIGGKKKKYFQEKYGPVLRDIILPRLKNIKEEDLLYKNRNVVLSKFESIYKNDFEGQF